MLTYLKEQISAKFELKMKMLSIWSDPSVFILLDVHYMTL